MEVKELIEKYSKLIIDETNPKEQEKALTEVIVSLLNELNEVVSTNNYKKKKDIKLAIENSNNKYIEFVSEINKLAKKDLLRNDGFKLITDKQFRFFF